MKRCLSLALILLLSLACTGCTGQAAARPGEAGTFEQTSVPLESGPTLPPEDGQPLPGESQSPPEETPPAEEEPAEEEPPAEPEEEEPYVRVIDPAKPMVALTFDDGPHAEWSNRILDVLEEYHALATFFEVGRNVAKYPEVVAREYELGCEVASHSNAHKNLGKMKKAAIIKDLDTADEAFVAAGVPAPTMVRPPYGSVNSAVKSQTGRTMVTWSVDTEDWKSRNAKKVIEYVQGFGNLDGHVVLMHSIYESTAEAVEVLVPWLQEQGYQLVTVTELMAYYYGELPEANKLYGYTYFTKNGRTDTPLELPQPETSGEAEAPAA